MAKLDVYEIVEEYIHINTAGKMSAEDVGEQKELVEAKDEMSESNQQVGEAKDEIAESKQEVGDVEDKAGEAKDEETTKKLLRKRRRLRARTVISLGNITEFIMREEYEFQSIKLRTVHENDGEAGEEIAQPQDEFFGSCFLFVKGPALYTASAKAERFLLNREFRLYKWPKKDGFDYSRNHIVGLKHYAETATAVSVVICGRDGLLNCLMKLYDSKAKVVDNSVRDWIKKNTERMESPDTEDQSDGDTVKGPKPRTSKDEVNRILMHYMETSGGGEGGGTLLRGTAGVKTPERGGQNNIIAFSCSVDGKVKMFNARSAELLRVYERVGYKLGEGEDKLDVTKDKSKRDMKSNPGHIGAVNGCLLLPVFPLEEELVEEDDGKMPQNSKQDKEESEGEDKDEDEIDAFTDPDRHDTERLLPKHVRTSV